MLRCLQPRQSGESNTLLGFGIYIGNQVSGTTKMKFGCIGHASVVSIADILCSDQNVNVSEVKGDMIAMKRTGLQFDVCVCQL